mmetsp:Transcript_28317/g.92452  ORF Transcript_28317/g.92452 Transcript_28317/m.92452 type:complete len:214 (-) Transcript_28317:934-1575(-)
MNGSAELLLGLAGGELEPDGGAEKVEADRDAPHLVPAPVFEDEARGGGAEYAREHARGVGDAEQEPGPLGADVLVVAVEPRVRKGVAALRDHQEPDRLGRRVDGGEDGEAHGGAEEPHALHHFARLGHLQTRDELRVREPARAIRADGHRDPRQDGEVARLEEVHAEHVVVICGHPRQEDEGAPVVAKVAAHDGSHRRARENLSPRYRLRVWL